MKILRIHSLEKGWCDKDQMMLHAAFQLLVDYVEQEQPEKNVDWTSDPQGARGWKEIEALYYWWTKTRPARRSPLDNKDLKRPEFEWRDVPGTNCRELMEWDKKEFSCYEAALKLHSRLEKKWNEEDQINFHRLVDVRLFLWT